MGLALCSLEKTMGALGFSVQCHVFSPDGRANLLSEEGKDTAESVYNEKDPQTQWQR